MGRGIGSGSGRLRDASDRDVSPASGDRSLVVVVNDMSWSFLVAPVGIKTLLLALFAFTWHNLVGRGANRGDTWPIQWW